LPHLGLAAAVAQMRQDIDRRVATKSTSSLQRESAPSISPE